MREIRDAPWIRRAESEGFPTGEGYVNLWEEPILAMTGFEMRDEGRR